MAIAEKYSPPPAVANEAPPTFALPLEVEAAGPFQEATKVGIIRPGVNLLRARNGWGKTSLMRMLVAFAKKQLKTGDVTVNDERTGSTAKVQFGPASMRAKLGRRPAREGHEQLPPIEGLPEPISSLEAELADSRAIRGAVESNHAGSADDADRGDGRG